MNELTRPYPFAVRPLHRETSESYTRRLLAANFDTEQHRQHLLRANGARTVAEQAIAWPAMLAVKTANRPLRLDGDEHGWLRHLDGTSCASCADLLPTRWMCTHCSHGALVEQHPHFDSPVCLRHRRWVGIFGDTSSQHKIGSEHIESALQFTKLRRAGVMDVRMYRILVQVLSEERAYGGPIQEAGVFSNAVALATHLTKPGFAQAVFDPSVPFRTAYLHVAETVRLALGRRSPRVSRAIWLYMRGTATSLRACLGAGKPYYSSWAHDFPLHVSVANRFVTPSDGLQPFAQYLEQTRDTAASATQYTFVGVEARLVQEGTQTRRHRELAICSNGHQFEADAVPAGFHPVKPKAPACPTCRGTVIVAEVNDLATTHPEVAAEFAEDLNEGLTSHDVAAATRHKYWWRCPSAHPYQATPNNRTSGNSGCPVCLQRIVIAGINDITTTHPDIAAEWHPSYVLQKPPTSLSSGSKDRVRWLCADEHDYWMRVNERVAGPGCPTCRRRKAAKRRDNLTMTHPQLAAEWHTTLNGDDRPEHFTAGSAHKAAWSCPEGHEYWTRIERRAHGYNCKVCSHRVLVRSVNDLATTDAVLVTEYDDERNDRPASTVFAGTEKAWWTCSAAGHVVHQSVPNRRKTRGCLHCPRPQRVLLQ